MRWHPVHRVWPGIWSSRSIGRNTSTVVEYGPGTGSITEEILGQLPPDTTFLAIEISSRFAEMLRTRFPGVRICEGSVSKVKDHCATNGVEHVDAIVSGLPWASFSDEDQTAYLDATMQVLRPGGQFITYGYLQGLLLARRTALSPQTASGISPKCTSANRCGRICRPPSSIAAGADRRTLRRTSCPHIAVVASKSATCGSVGQLVTGC